MIERTLAMIKPDAVKAKNSGAIIDIIEKNNFDILRMEKIQLSKEKAKQFYAIHKGKPFFDELIDFVTSGPVIVMVLQKDNAIQVWRDLMGCTDSRKAASGTIRNLFGTDKSINAVHGSDSPETAKQEIAYFFPQLER
jgi:nucleoside-diphosphate kinase